MGKIKRTEFQDLDGGQNAGDPNDSREKTMSLHLIADVNVTAYASNSTAIVFIL